MTSAPATGRSRRFPFSRPFAVDGLPARGTAVTVTASEAEEAALAADLDILGVSGLAADLTVTPWRSSGLRVRGTVRAGVTQACVVTLEPVEQRVAEEVDIRMLPAAEIGPEEAGEEIEIDAEGEDPPEPFEGGSIDLGQIVAEHLALGLDPYPRAPGASFDALIEDDGSDDAKENPFARLAALKRPDGDG